MLKLSELVRNASKASSENVTAEALNKTLPKPELAVLQRKANVKRDEIDRHARAEELFRNNSKACHDLKAEILLGLTAQRNIYTLFLKAVKAVSLTTNDIYFYSQAEQSVLAVYSEGLEEELAVEAELEQIEQRLEKLRNSSKKEGLEAGELERIKTAIKADERKQQELANIIHKKRE